jgi:muramoyltetrapeptide carboxypeptidase
VELFVQGREAILGWQSDARLAHGAHDHDHHH